MIGRGFTLIELVIALVVLAALGAALTTVVVEGSRASADPMIRAQARAIAEGYMEEILLKAYEDPEDATGEPGAEAGETRATYDDVWDYQAIGTEDPTDQDGNPSAGGALTDYDVTVAITGTHGVDPATVRVTVDHTSGRVSYQLSSLRADY